MSNGEIQIVDGTTGPALPIVAGQGVARAIIWPGIGARSRSLHRIWLEADGATIEMKHPSDAVYYVIDGGGFVVDRGTDSREDLRPGSMIHIDAGTSYVIGACGEGMQVIGGPAPADDALYAHLSAEKG